MNWTELEATLIQIVTMMRNQNYFVTFKIAEVIKTEIHKSTK